MNESALEASLVECARCGKKIEKEKSNSVSASRGRGTLAFCDSCFPSVFKYDKNVKTLVKIWEENSREFPFTARKKSWHPSTYMVVKSIAPGENSGGKKAKTKFVADLYLHGELKDSDKAVGNANSFLWLAWSEKEAKENKWEGGGEDLP